MTLALVVSLVVCAVFQLYGAVSAVPLIRDPDTRNAATLHVGLSLASAYLLFHMLAATL